MNEETPDRMMLDWSRVNELKDELGAEDFEEIVTLFLEEVGEKLDAMQGDAGASVADDLHFVKGSAANLGFESLRLLCEQMENGNLAVSAGKLAAEYQLSKTELIAKALD
ncbi:MAG: Hpt domain-containing protein [Litoreibacter sp.]|uniref:Hpt domain-containing protein n=1 Tax=Litoreibacter sp. TaxID=1969459 RepID=UPI0032975D0B